MPRFTGLDPFTMSAYRQLGPEAQRDILATQGQEIDPLPYLAGQISGASIAGGVPGPRYGLVSGSSNLRGLARRLLQLLRGKTKQAAPELTRPWPGVYQRTLQEGRTQPLSYRSPTTTELPEEATGLRELLESLGGSYFGIKR